MSPILYDTREVTIPKARELTELKLIYDDIEHAICALNIIVSVYPQSSDESRDTHTVRLSLFRDAIVQFAGCFGQSRFKIDEKNVYKSQYGQLEYFYFIKALRDTFAAHAFGPSRQCSCFVGFDGEGNVKAIMTNLMVYTGPDNNNYAVMAGFMQIALSYVDYRISIVQKEVEVLVKAMSAIELNALPSAILRVPGHEDLRKSRADFKSGKPSTR